MKNLLPTILLLLFVFPGFQNYTSAQSISIGADTIDNKVNHKSTGYGYTHPLDIPDDKGLYMYSNDGQKALRIYGSFRMLFVLDDKQQFQPYELDPPTIPTGEDDFIDYHATWTMNETRLGLDALFGNKKKNGILFRIELDWKGSSEAFRIRHVFMRTKHWVIGSTWTTFAGFPYFPETVEGHMAGSASGQRVPQIRYYNKVNNWKYQFGVEYKTASLIQPDTLGAVARVIFPTMVGRFLYGGDWGQVGMAAMVRPNRVQFTGDEKRAQSLMGYAANVGLKLNIGKSNLIQMSGYAGSGFGSYIAEYSYVPIELVYNPETAEFENMDLYGAFAAYKRTWSKTLASTITGGYDYAINKSYQDDLAFNYCAKAMVNLFYKPQKKMKGLVMGTEILYAERWNKNTTSNRAFRAYLLLYYDF